ncbi:MAG TPA: hypothetical protein VIQ30_09145 [Pseudonocardia sp.]
MTTINGLPAHILLVHAVIALIPLSAILLLLIAWWPAARSRLSLFAVVTAGLALVSVPITTDAGDWLEHHLPRTPQLRIHTELGDYMLPWAIALFVITAMVAAREFVRTRRSISALQMPASDSPQAAPAGPATGVDGIGGRPLTVALAIVALIAAAGSTATVYRIGDSGARAAWSGKYSQTEIPDPEQRGAGD